jgi:hypothetical protein
MTQRPAEGDHPDPDFLKKVPPEIAGGDIPALSLGGGHDGDDLIRLDAMFQNGLGVAYHGDAFFRYPVDPMEYILAGSALIQYCVAPAQGSGGAGEIHNIPAADEKGTHAATGDDQGQRFDGVILQQFSVLLQKNFRRQNSGFGLHGSALLLKNGYSPKNWGVPEYCTNVVFDKI